MPAGSLPAAIGAVRKTYARYELFAGWSFSEITTTAKVCLSSEPHTRYMKLTTALRVNRPPIDPVAELTSSS